MKDSIHFKANFDDVQEMAHFDNSDDDEENNRNKKNTSKPTTAHKKPESQVSLE